jgi:hypothetical protein
VREVPSAEWRPFLDQFSRDHRAWLATVECVRRGGRSQIAAAGRPLEAVKPERSGRGGVAIVIEFQGTSGADGGVKVMDAKYVRVKETPESRVLEIEDARGECTRLRFRAPPPGEMLDGVAPGEF